jgi:hypothetical protein
MSSRQRRNKFGEQFIMHPRELRESIAWRYLPNNGRRALDRLELEHMQHGGLENGELPCTYDDFAEAGIRRPSVALALRQCVALGFLEVTQRGGRSRAENRWPSKYRLTYVHGAGKSPLPTHDWSKIKTKAEAEAALRFAAISKSDRRVRKRNTIRGVENVPTAIAEPGTKTYLQC